METRYKWILGLMLAAIFLGSSSVQTCVLTINSNQCPNITLLSPGSVCYYAPATGNVWTATITCKETSTNHTCSPKDKQWHPIPANCTDSSSETTAAANTTNNNDTTTATTPTTINNTAAATITTTSNQTSNTSASNIPSTSSATTMTYTLNTSDENHTEPIVRQKQRGRNVALYVSVPIVIVVLVIVLILFIICRRKHRNTEKKQNGFAFHNESYRRHNGTNSNNAPIAMSDMSSTADDNQYSVIPADTVNPVSENDESTYNTIDLPEGVRDNYCHVTTKTTVPNDNTYSHMPDNSSLPITDNTYSHIGNSATGSTMFQKKPTDGSADTYNTLQTLPNNRVGLHTKPRKTDIENGDIDAEYNHLSNTLKRPAEAEEEENADTYSHICQSAKPDREYTEQEKKTHVLNQQSKADLKNNEYESALGVCPPYLEFKVEDHTDGDASTKQFKILENPTNETNNYEVAQTHQYFELEKDNRMAV